MRYLSDELLIASEAVQREAWRELSCSIPLEHRISLDVATTERGSTFYQAAKRVDLPQFNKVYSFGLEGDLSDSNIELARDWLIERCANSSFVMVPPITTCDDLDERMARYDLIRYPIDIAICHLDSRDIDVPNGLDMDVRVVSPSDATLFGQTLCDGMGTDPLAAIGFSSLIGRPGMSGYIAYDGPIAMGAAALYVSDGWGWLWLAATRRKFRNRGVQTRLLGRRLHDGRAAGVHTFCVGVFCPVDNVEDSFASYRNVGRAGFEVAYQRPNFTLKH